jgi:hypothetical protein
MRPVQFVERVATQIHNDSLLVILG